MIFVHETEKERLEWAGVLCWYKPEKLAFDELKKQGNDRYKYGDFEGCQVL